MDAHKFGAFVARRRKERNMTQADLASKIQVTDKAVSRWERGLGFPDINIIEPLADALEVSVLELMKSERMAANLIAGEEAAEAIADVLNVARLQRKRERRNVFRILGVTAVIVFFFFLLTVCNGGQIQLSLPSPEWFFRCFALWALLPCCVMGYGEKQEASRADRLLHYRLRCCFS